MCTIEFLSGRVLGIVPYELWPIGAARVESKRELVSFMKSSHDLMSGQQVPSLKVRIEDLTQCAVYRTFIYIAIVSIPLNLA